MLPLMAADCADASAPAVLTLHESKHAAERAMVSADNFDDDDDAAAPVSATKAPSDRARLSGGPREARNVKKSGPNAKPRAGEERPVSAEQDCAPLRPHGPGVEGGKGEGGTAGHDRDLAVDVLSGEHMNGGSVVAGGCVGLEALPVVCTVALGSLAVGFVAGMVLARR
jgi:hypothetical protein